MQNLTNDFEQITVEIFTNRATIKFMKSGSDKISRIGLHTTFASIVLRKLRNGRHLKSSAGMVKYKSVSMACVKYSAAEVLLFNCA